MISKEPFQFCAALRAENERLHASCLRLGKLTERENELQAVIDALQVQFDEAIRQRNAAIAITESLKAPWKPKRDRAAYFRTYRARNPSRRTKFPQKNPKAESSLVPSKAESGAGGPRQTP